MATIQHVYRRGAVYWWRRRLPTGSGSRAFVRIELSLITRYSETAKAIASEVTQVCERLIPGLRTAMISAEDAKKILIQVAMEHSAHLDFMAAATRGRSVDVDEKRRSEICSGWAQRLFAAHGKGAKVGPNEEREMLAAGLDAAMVRKVSDLIVFLRNTGFGQVGRPLIERILNQHDIPVVDAHVRQAEALYHRGLAAALFNTERRWSGARHDDLALVQAALAADVAVPSRPVAAPTSNETRNFLDVPPFRPVPSAPQPIDNDSEQGVRVLSSLTEAIVGKTNDKDYRGLVELVERAALQRVRDKTWTGKTADQHVALAKLFVRFVGHDNPANMRQSQIADLKEAFYRMPKYYGKSPQDFVISFSDLIKRAERLPPEKVGLAPPTLNRHMTQMSNIVDICKHAGFSFGSFEGVSGLRSKLSDDDESDDGPKFSTEEVRALVSQPIWNGAKSEKKRYIAGNVIIHDAAYWVPLLAIYQAARREELCGLLVSDIDHDGSADLYCMRILPSDVRRLKNKQSKRAIPLHSEIIRLGFIDYVEAIRSSGQRLMFPELRAKSASTPLGDVFDGSWQKISAYALPNAKEEGKVFHRLRHWCNNEMKQASVHAEVRKDILGHKNVDMNEGTYSQAARLRLMANALEQVPCVTAELVRHPIRLSSA